MSTTTTIDQAALEELVGRVISDMGATMQAPLMLLGNRLGLFRALAEGPLTTADLAARTGSSERYVREWVRTQAAALYVAYDPATDRYFLTPEQALIFAQTEGPSFVFGGFEMAVAAGKIAPRLEGRFRDGHGIGWHEHDHGVFCGTARFFEPSYRESLVASWIPALDGAEARLRAGARVADVGCGHGVSTLLMAEAYPESEFVGFDYHPASIDDARADAHRVGLDGHVRFEVASAKDFPGAGYDLITLFDCLHDLGDPVGAAIHAREGLAPDGVCMIVEPSAADRVEDNLNPLGRARYAASTLLCTPNSLSQEVGRAMGAAAGPAAIRAVIEEAGFTRIRLTAETPFNLVFEARR
jgi:SAM-dependent methyltransferase